MTPFDILKVLSHTKKYMEKDQEFRDAYVPFLINKGLSLSADTVLLANEMNLRSHIPVEWQFDYLFYTVKPRARYEKWPKKVAENENLELIKQFYGYNTSKAKMALSLLDDSQIRTIKEYSKGGIVYDK